MFEKTQFKLKENSSSQSLDLKDIQVSQPIVKKFEMTPILKTDNNYTRTKLKFGSLAETDLERGAKARKDNRFTLNPLLRETLSVEQEERRAIEEKVQARLLILTENEKKKAEEEGYQVGVKKGYQDSIEKLKQESVLILKQLSQLLHDFEVAKSEIYQANERFIIELIFKIAKSIVLKEISVDKDYVSRLAKELIQRIGVRDCLKLFIHTEDAENIENLRQNLSLEFNSLNNLSVEVSSQIERGGCRVESEWSFIETSLEQQLNAIHQELIGKAGLVDVEAQ